jgi:hypothetical protein
MKSRMLVVLVLLAAVPAHLYGHQQARQQKVLENCYQLAQSAGNPVEVARAERCVLRVGQRLKKERCESAAWVEEQFNGLLSLLSIGADDLAEGSLTTAAAKTITQAKMNKIVKKFLQGSVAGKQCVKSCAALTKGMKSGSHKCASGGSASISLRKCVKNTASLGISFNSCRASKQLQNGKSALTFTVTPKQLSTVLSASGLNIDGFALRTSGIRVTNKCQNGVYAASKCAGNLTSGSKTCRMKPDCSACLFPRKKK